MLGSFVSLYLAQGPLSAVRSALSGIDIELLLEKTDNIQSDETFALLQEFGTVLQVNIADMLNRSLDRPKALDTYISSLTTITERSQQKFEELESRLEDISDQRREQRSVVRDIEREIRDALRSNQYASAGERQDALTKEEAKLAEIETIESQTQDVQRIFRDLIEVSTERLAAVTQNREVILAGLQVIDVPGIEELNLVIDD
jgi:predicted RNase H-like nuclease (RuvC/YqgF family)